MTNLNIEQHSQVAEEVSSSVIDKLYRLAVTSKVEDPTNSLTMSLSGHIYANAAYEDAVLYLRAKFPNLTIDVTNNNYYVRFIDPEVESICLANFSSDGVGLSKSNAAGVADLSNKFSNNPNINSLADLHNFTNPTINISKLCTFSGTYLNNTFPTEMTAATGTNPFIVNEISLLRMPNSLLSVSGDTTVIGSDSWKAKVKVNNVDWGTSTVLNSDIRYLGSIFSGCILTWDDSLVPNQTEFTAIRLFHSCSIDKVIFREGILKTNDNFRSCTTSYIEFPTTIIDVENLFADFRRDSSGVSNNTGCIVIKAVNPPTAESGTINDGYNKWPAHIYVPDNSVAAYKAASGHWQNSTVNGLITPMSLMAQYEREAGTVTLEDIDRT